MLKDYPEHIFKEFKVNKKLRVLLELALFIEKETNDFQTKHFSKLSHYHSFIANEPNKFLKMAHKEFLKIKDSKRQFQIYITLLERLVGNSSKEYQFMMQTGDSRKSSQKIPVRVILDGVRSTHNIGAIIRTAECFAIEKIYIHRPYDDFDESIFFKTAQGAQQFIDCEFYQDVNLILKKQQSDNYQLICVDTLKEAKPYNQMVYDQALTLVFGHEQLGVSKEVIESSDFQINIPLIGNKNSLNVSVSCGIILSHIHHSFINN